MIEQLLANPYAGDGTEHPDMHLIHVEQICGLFKLAGLPGDEVMKRFSLYLCTEKHWHGIGYAMILDLGIGVPPKILSYASSSS